MSQSKNEAMKEWRKWSVESTLWSKSRVLVGAVRVCCGFSERVGAGEQKRLFDL